MGLREIWRRRRFGDLAFLHVPKTGGTYLLQLESEEKKPIVGAIKRLGHVCVVDTRHPRSAFPLKAGIRDTIRLSSLRGYYVAATVRNPFDWLVSYAGHAGGWNPKYHDTDHYDYKNVQKGFDYLLKTIADREDIWPCRKFLFFQLFCDNGGLVVDWINRAERLDDDMADLARMWGLPFQKKERQRQGVRGDYREYYDDKLIDLVNTVWGRELDLFGYGFDGFDEERATLKREIDRVSKRRVHYLWDRDELRVDGAVLS